MNRSFSLAMIGTVMCILFGCSQAPVTLQATTPAKPQPTATKRIDTGTSTTVRPTKTILPQDTPTQVVASFPLSDPGPYFVGNRTYTLIDESRNGREIRLTIWYPALMQTDADGRPIKIGAAPDLSGAPYPMILTGSNSGNYVYKTHLAFSWYCNGDDRPPRSLSRSESPGERPST